MNSRACRSALGLLGLCAAAAIGGEVDPVAFPLAQHPAPAAAATAAPQPAPFAPIDDRLATLRMRNALIAGTAAALFAGYGMSHWWETGFGAGFKTHDEGWFGRSTASGGADKLGHSYSNYATVRLLAPLFESAGNSPDSAVSLAAWTTLGIFTGIEVVDGFSRQWRFSPQDALANVAGVALGVMMETHPQMDEIFDFRVAYRRSQGSRFDPFGDYSGQKYLLVVKADGFPALRRQGVLRYLELSVGYGARGFDPGGERHRDVYFGLSLNLARLLGDAAYEGRMHSTPFQRGTDRVFDLVQFPAVGYARRSLD